MISSKREHRSFFSNIGFDDDPFAYTNADEEERLSEYFIPPPYFASVFGNPTKPKSFVVFAPRGGGKSAQRRMIEEACGENNVLSITYDNFDFPSIKKASNASLEHHLSSITRYLIIAILASIHADPSHLDKLSKYDKETIVFLSSLYLARIQEHSIKKSLDSLKSIKNKVQEFWIEWLPIINLGITAALKLVLGSDVDLQPYEKAKDTKDIPYKYQLDLLLKLVEKIGYVSTYILVDRVDESELTGNNAKASFELIQSLLKDLELLETKGIGFKFFLWDQLEPYYQDIARTDRIMQETLEWDNDMLMDMWSKRLLAYSQNQIKLLSDISEPIQPVDIDQLSVIFASKSPRDMIRIGAQILSEQREKSSESKLIDTSSVYKGIDKFSEKRTSELLSPKSIHELRRVQEIDFTIPFLANEIFKEKQSSTRNRLLKWRHEGAIVDVDRVDNPSPQHSTPVKLMAIADIRLARIMQSDLDIPTFLSQKYRLCPRCGACILRDWFGESTVARCHECQFDLSQNEDLDEWEKWKREQRATESRRLRRHEQREFYQSSFFDKEFNSEKE